MTHLDPLPSCCFCSELSSGLLPEEYRLLAARSRRIVAASPSFVAMPSVSPLAAGHVLVLPLQHVTSLARLSVVELGELAGFAANLGQRVEHAFGPVFFFEHGVSQDRAGACGVDHAHLHVVPLDPAVAASVEQVVAAQYATAGATELVGLATRVSRRESYLAYGHHLDSLRYAVAPDIQSQYLRRLIAQARGQPAWDWRELFGWSEFARTVEALGLTE